MQRFCLARVLCAHGLCLKCNYAEAKKERDQLRAEVGKLRAQLKALAERWNDRSEAWQRRANSYIAEESEKKHAYRCMGNRLALLDCARELRAILAEGGP